VRTCNTVAALGARHARGLELRFRLAQLRGRDRGLRARVLDRALPGDDLLPADRARIAGLGVKRILAARDREARPGRRDLAAQAIDPRLRLAHRGAGVAAVDREERRSRGHIVSGRDEHPVDDAGHLRADLDELARGLDQPGAGDHGPAVRHGRGASGLCERAVRLRPQHDHDRHDDRDHGQDGQDLSGEVEAGHGVRVLNGPWACRARHE
jgi:hypothetical protein